MGIDFHPGLGEALWCAYEGLPPEMIKRRLAVVVTPKACQRHRLVTVVPISTTPPQSAKPWHVRLKRDPLPGSNAEVWVKCDMVNVVSFDRLQCAYRRWNGRREYKPMRVSPEEIVAIRAGILHSLGFRTGDGR